MSRHISKSQFKAKALQFFRQVETTGETLVVTDQGEPRIEIRRYQPPSSKPFEVLRGSVLRYDRPMSPVGAEDWDAER
jgi:hypothetical protein